MTTKQKKTKNIENHFKTTKKHSAKHVFTSVGRRVRGAAEDWRKSEPRWKRIV